MYKVKTKGSPARFVVINEANNQDQSAWTTYSEAREVAEDLNKVKKKYSKNVTAEAKQKLRSKK